MTEKRAGASSGFPGRPRLLRGALEVRDPDREGTKTSRIVFQYNPEKIQRTLASRAAPKDQGGKVGKAREDIRRVLGPPVETITMSVVLNAADQLGAGQPDALVAKYGLYPVVATLELLLYPKSYRVKDNQNLAKKGTVQLQQADVPLVILELSKKRKMPIFLTSFSIAEEAFDQNMNPIRAKVDLGMRVLTYMELDDKGEGRKTYVTYQETKENLAQQFAEHTTPAAKSRAAGS
jgi:hypothetical protein